MAEPTERERLVEVYARRWAEVTHGPEPTAEQIASFRWKGENDADLALSIKAAQPGPEFVIVPAAVGELVERLAKKART